MTSVLFSQVLQFVPPKLVKNSLGYHIEYRVVDPSTGKLKRKRFRLNQLQKQCKTQKEFLQQAQQVVLVLTNKLSQGWSPYGENVSSRYYVPIFDAMDRFLETKAKELRPDSMRTYRGIVRIFKEWFHQPGTCIEFTQEQALDFMDYCFTKRDISTTTYNTYLKLCRVIFSWLQENLYVKENFFVKIRKKRPSEKIREVIPHEVREQIVSWCLKNNPNFLLYCELICYSLIRPKEISRIQIKHLQLEDNCIYLPAEITKCHFDRHAAVSPAMVEKLNEYIAGYKPDDYLFGRGFQPSAKPFISGRFVKTWEKMRDDLDLPVKYQLYSLRDTGITMKLDSGMNAMQVMCAAGHHDLGETTKYLQRSDKHFIQALVNQSPEFI